MHSTSTVMSTPNANQQAATLKAPNNLCVAQQKQDATKEYLFEPSPQAEHVCEDWSKNFVFLHEDEAWELLVEAIDTGNG